MNRIIRRVIVTTIIYSVISVSCVNQENMSKNAKHVYNGNYSGKYLERIAFPIGGIGAGMFCIEGTGSISNMSVRNRPEVYNEPCMFAAVSVKGIEYGTKILEGQVPDWKKFGQPGSANGSAGTSYGLPRFQQAKFISRFPFAQIELKDDDLPLEVKLKGWSPFIPTDADNSSLPVGAIEYSFRNTGSSKIEAVFSYSSRNFMGQNNGVNSIKKTTNGFILSQDAIKDKPELKGDFAIFTSEPNTIVDYCWFRGGWWDPLTITWETIMKGETRNTDTVTHDAPGASLFVPIVLNNSDNEDRNKVYHVVYYHSHYCYYCYYYCHDVGEEGKVVLRR